MFQDPLRHSILQVAANNAGGSCLYLIPGICHSIAFVTSGKQGQVIEIVPKADDMRKSVSMPEIIHCLALGGACPAKLQIPGVPVIHILIKGIL